MAFKLNNRVRETSTTTGTGAYALGGAVTGRKAVSAVLANGDTAFFLSEMGADWEVFLGTWNTGNTLSRTTIYKSTNANAAVNWGAGVKRIAIIDIAPSDLDAAGLQLFLTLLGLGTGNTPQFTGIEIGHASDTTLTKNAAGLLQVEGNIIPHLSYAATWLAAQKNTAQPAFCAYVDTTVVNVTGDGTTYTVLFNAERFDQASNYNPATGVYTASVGGRHQLDAHALLDDVAAGHTVFILIIFTSNFTYYGYSADLAPDASGLAGLFLSVLADMDANDTAYVTITVSGATKVVDIGGGAGGYSTFSGFLAC